MREWALVDQGEDPKIKKKIKIISIVL